MTEPPWDLSLRHLARIVDSSDDAIVSKDLDGTILSWNRAAERMFGYTAEEAIGRSIRIVIPADRQDEEDTVLSEIRHGRAVSHFETIRQRKDGTLFPISLTVSPIHNEQGVVIAASKIARDITERSRLLELAHEQQEITRRLNEVGALVAASLDRETVVQRVTDLARELTGAEFGAFFYNVVEPSSAESYMLYTLSGAPREAFANFPMPRATAIFAPTFHGERVMRIADVTKDPRYGQSAPHHGMPPGHLPVRSYLAVSVKTASGEVIGGLFFGHSRPGVFNERHEQMVTGVSAWASVALENARLYREAQEADRLKDDFLAVLSHELRTPLNAILGYSRLVRSNVLQGEKAANGLETIERNAASLTQIVEDVLDVSRIVTGKIRLDVRPVDLPIIVHNAIATMQPAADARGVRLQATIDPRVGPVSGDPDRLQQVVWNLLSNAVKFTPRKGRVQIRLESVNSHIELAVSDTGIGIKPEFLPHVFERFRQAEASTTRTSGGLGLGLSIAKHIVELHGGSVDASSGGEGQGATFCIRLPLMIVHPPAMAEIRQHPRAGSVAAPLPPLTGLDGVTVLAVDDEEDALSLLQAVLEAAGARVTTRSSAKEALDELGHFTPDVLVVDLGMPHMDGFEFITRLRSSARPEVRDLPAAALTAFARSEDRTKALRSGFEIHLAKPIDPAELVAAVLRLVRRTPFLRQS